MNAMKSFNQSTELLRFATEAYVVAIACDLLDVNNESDITNANELSLKEVSSRILDMAFQPPDPASILEAMVDASDESEDEDEDDEGYCVCNEDKEGSWVMCNNRVCRRGKWFHLECLNLEMDDLPDGEWFCCGECNEVWKKKREKKQNREKLSKDWVFEYTKALLWRGLGEMARHDTLRENDGPRIIMHWRFDIIEFLTHNHTKYFVFAFRLLTSVSGKT